MPRKCSRRAVNMQPDGRRSAVHVQSICSPLAALHAATCSFGNALLSVCAAFQVSVTVRLPCLSMGALQGTSGHHARFVSLFCCWPARHGIGTDGAVGPLIIVESLPRTHGLRRGGAGTAISAESGPGDGTVLHGSLRCDGPEQPVTTVRHYKNHDLRH